MMNLILWRHAEAEDIAPNDLARALTPHGLKQAQAVAQWLERRIDRGTSVLVSPAVRTVQTAQTLTDRYRVAAALAPGAKVQDVLETAGWRDESEAASTVLIVGHQPTLGRVAAHLVAGIDTSGTNSANWANWTIKKGGLWWLERRRGEQTIVRAVITPDLVMG